MLYLPVYRLELQIIDKEKTLHTILACSSARSSSYGGFLDWKSECFQGSPNRSPFKSLLEDIIYYLLERI